MSFSSLSGGGTQSPSATGFCSAADARLLAEGKAFIYPTLYDSIGLSWPMAMKAPLYTVYLAGWSLVGVDSYEGQRLVSTLVGVAVVPVCGWVVYRLAGSRAGLVAAVLAAANPSLWIADASLLSESMYAVCVAGTVWASYRLWDRPEVGRAAVLGAIIGLAALTRYEGLAFLPLAIPLFVGLPRRPSTKVYLFTVSSLVVVGCMAPWSAYNLGRFEEPVLLGPSPGPLTMSANCDTTYSGPLLGYHDLGCASIAEDEVAALVRGCPCPVGDRQCLVDRCLSLMPDESQLFDYMHEQGLDYVREHPRQVPVVVAARVGRIWNVFRPLQGLDLDTRSRGARMVALPAWFGPLLGPGSAGDRGVGDTPSPQDPHLAAGGTVRGPYLGRGCHHGSHALPDPNRCRAGHRGSGGGRGLVA